MSLKAFFKLIKIEHTLFALPLALTGAILAARGMPDKRILILLAIAFTGARASAMAFNRLVDRRVDALNPRTASREIPSGVVSAAKAGALVAASVVVFLASAWVINPLCGKLAPLALVVLLGYSYTKRFTALCHFILGLALGMAPVAGWLAVTGAFSWPPVVLGLGVIFWTAGFDMIYALQDLDFDRKYRIHSVGAHFGVKFALVLSALNHTVFLILTSIALIELIGVKALIGLIVIAILLTYEHYIVKDRFDERRIQIAFFHLNATISAVLLLTILLGLLF